MKAGGPRFDAVRFFDESTALLRLATSGEPGLVTIRRVGDIALWMLAAAGVALVEFGPAVGRVIAASGDAHNGLGRRVESGDERIRTLTGSAEVRVGTLDDLPEDLRFSGGARFMFGPVMLGARCAGGLIAYLDDGEGDPTRLAAMRFFTAILAQTYREGRGLPLHAKPAVPAPSGSTLVLDADNAVCWIDPASAAMLQDTLIALGVPMPLPVPGPGQIIEHDLPDGRWLQITAKARPDAHGTSVTIKDITEARRYEQSRELFVALTSHELRTPVTVIKGYADTLNNRWDSLDERGRRFAASILGQRADDLARLLDRLLSAVSDLDAPAVVTRFNLACAVREALDALPDEIRERLNVVVPEDLPLAWGEERSIAGVVSELVTNAGKYSPSAAGVIEIECDHDDTTVGIRVSDHGIGVRPEHVERAFERFWQADTGDHRRYGGVGLGLYLVRRVVERQAGWVFLAPRKSGGTVAEVRLPRADRERPGHT